MKNELQADDVKIEGNSITITVHEDVSLKMPTTWQVKTTDGEMHEITDPDVIAELEALSTVLLAMPEEK